MFFLFSVPPRHVRDLIILISRWAAGGFWGWKPFKHLLRRKSQPCRQKSTIFSTWFVAFENWQSQVGQRWNFHCPVCLQGRLLFVACKLREYIPKASKSLSTVTARKFEMLRYFDLCLLWSGSGKNRLFFCILHTFCDGHHWVFSWDQRWRVKCNYYSQLIFCLRQQKGCSFRFPSLSAGSFGKLMLSHTWVSLPTQSQRKTLIHCFFWTLQLLAAAKLVGPVVCSFRLVPGPGLWNYIDLVASFLWWSLWGIVTRNCKWVAHVWSWAFRFCQQCGKDFKIVGGWRVHVYTYRSIMTFPWSHRLGSRFGACYWDIQGVY